MLAVLLTLQLFLAAVLAPAQVQKYDVVISGSTPAAIAAAIAASRRGVRVGFITRHTTLGGELTLGMLTQWDVKTDPQTGELPTGIFREFYRALPDGFDPHYAAQYFAHRIEYAPGVRWIAGAKELQATRVPGRDGIPRISAIRFTDSKGRRIAAEAPCFIDATMNADVAALAGVRYDVGRQDTGRDSRMQPVTLLFSLAGVDWARVSTGYDAARFGPGGMQADRTWGYSSAVKDYRPLSKRALVRDANFQLQNDGTVMVNAIDILGIDGRSKTDLAKARKIAERESAHFTDYLRERIPGFEHARITRFAPQMYVRETRHIRGMDTIDASYIWNGKHTYDTIAYAAYPLDIHPVVRKARGGDGWASDPHRYGIPLRALVAADVRNLAVAGAGISATHSASGSLRVLPTTIEEGEAAGAACALSAHKGRDLHYLAKSRPLVEALQKSLGIL